MRMGLSVLGGSKVGRLAPTKVQAATPLYLCNKKANDIREPDTRIRPERTEQEKTRLSRSCPLFFGSGGGGRVHKKHGLHRKGGTQALHERDGYNPLCTRLRFIHSIKKNKSMSNFNLSDIILFGIVIMLFFAIRDDMKSNQNKKPDNY